MKQGREQVITLVPSPQRFRPDRVEVLLGGRFIGWVDEEQTGVWLSRTPDHHVVNGSYQSQNQATLALVSAYHEVS